MPVLALFALLVVAPGVFADAAPTATISNCPTGVQVGDKAAFSGSGKPSDGGGKRSQLVYSWSFGDGGAGSTEQNPIHVYTAAGTYTATLTVTDVTGASATDTCSVSVTDPPPAAPPPPPPGNSAPTADFTSSQTTRNVSPTVSFTATASDSDGTIASYSWDFGDGTTGSGQTASHTYATGGRYTVTLTVADNGGATASAHHTVRTATGPSATITTCPGAAQVNTPVTFGGSGSAPGDGTIASLNWDFGDGTTGSGAAPSHAYASAGDKQVTLTATDSNGLTGAATAPCTVHVAAPAPMPAPAPTDPAARLQVVQGVHVSIAGMLKGGTTIITRLSVSAPAGATVRARCSRPRHSRSRSRVLYRSCGIRLGRVQTAGRAVRLRALERSFPARSRITVIVSKRGFIASVTTFTMRRGRQPLRQTLCLMPRSKTPGSCPLG